MGRLLIRPLGVAGTRWEAGAGAACCAALAAVLVLDLLTPNDVVATLGYLPMFAAMWMLSTRAVAAVGLAGTAVFWIVLVSEAGNRPTVAFIGAIGFVLAILVRTYATRLDAILRSSQHSAASKPWLSASAAGPLDGLTQRELEVAALASRGYTAAEIGRQLHISERTVESHLANAYAKLAIHSRAGLREMTGVLTSRR